MHRLRFWFRRERSIEDLLRAERPRPPRHLVRSIAASVRETAPRRLPVRGTARVVLLSGAMLVALFAVGGLGYAMNVVSDFVVKVTSSSVLVQERTAVRTIVVNAANDQYGTTTSGGGGGGGTTTTTTTTTTQTTTTATTTTTSSGSSGSVAVSSPVVQASVVWQPGTFSEQVIVKVSATPTVATPTLLGSNNQFVSINVTTPSGTPVHTLAAPLDIVFKNPTSGFVPVISEDGINFRALTEISGPPLPDSMQDGYYLGSDGTVHILTRHLTVFAVLYKANVNVSESGRKLAAPGSGAWGDPTRMHSGPPALKIVTAPSLAAKRVGLTFFVDEQAATYVRVIGAGGAALPLNLAGTTIRGHTVGGRTTKTLHVVILRPGTIKLNLLAPAAAAGAKVQLTVVDYDGHKVTRTVAVK